MANKKSKREKEKKRERKKEKQKKTKDRGKLNQKNTDRHENESKKERRKNNRKQRDAENPPEKNKARESLNDAPTESADSVISQPVSQHRGAPEVLESSGDVGASQQERPPPNKTETQIRPSDETTATTTTATTTVESSPTEAPTTPRTAPTAAGRSEIPIIFLAFANDRDDTVGYLRNLPNEARRLREVLESAEQAGLCEVVVRSNSTADDIFKVFQDPKYRNRVGVFHYGGHANGYQLLLESAAGQSAAADAGGLASFLAQQQGLQLVFLNGCSTQQQTEGLLDANISAVISTSRAIDDQVATDFSHQFYQGLAGGASVRTAYNEAEASVQTAKGGDTRSLYLGEAKESESRLDADRWPWNLYLREGSEGADQWNLPEAVNDPLFGLPALPEQDLPESPFRHLNWFTHKDAEVFFGRGHQIRELYDRLTAPRTAPIMLFYGQSGVGKSSILDAGLIPRLEQDYEVCYLRRTEDGLIETLKLAFLPEASDVPIETAWRVKEEQTGKPLIVFLDQVEELYTRPNAEVPDELDQLLEVVKATFVESGQRPQGKLVLGFRKEWLAELEAQLVDYELPRTKVFLEPLDRRGIIEVIQGPARSERLRERYGLTVDEGLAVIIADDLLEDRDSSIAPMLQILLTKMWTKATEENYEQPRFSQELYQQLKRDGILLRDFLNQQIAAFRQRYPEAVDSGLLLDIVALHTTPLGTADQRTIEQLQEHYAHLETALPAILQQCQDLHLLTVAASAQKESTKTTRLAHDTLAPLVRERFDVSDKPGQRARRILDNRSVDWEDEQTGTPLDEADLEVVEQGVVGTRALSSTEQRLLNASRELRAKLVRTRRTLKIAGLLAVTLIIVALGIALQQRSVALTREAEAVEAEAAANTARDKAVRSAYNLQIARVIDLYRRKPNEAKSILERCPIELRDFAWGFYRRLCNREIEYVPYEDAVNAVCFSRDGKRLATASDDGKVLIRTEVDNDKVNQISEYADQVRCLDFSPDEALVAYGSKGVIKVCNCETKSELVMIPRLPQNSHENKYIRSVLFVSHADGLLLASSAVDDPNNKEDGDSNIVAWDPVSGKQLWSEDLKANISMIVNGPEQGTLVAACADGSFKLCRADTAMLKLELSEQAHKQSIVAMATSRQEDAEGDFFLATAGLDGKVMVWIWNNRESNFLKVLEFDTSPFALATAISKDGQRIAWGSSENIEVRFLGDNLSLLNQRSLTIPRCQQIPADKQKEATILSLDFAPDGRTLASGSFDSVVIWNIDDSWSTTTGDDSGKRTRQEEQKPDCSRFGVDPEQFQCSAKSADESRIAIGLKNGDIVVAMVASGEPVEFSPIQTQAWVERIAWSADGVIVSSEGGEPAGRIKLWDSMTGEPRGTLDGHTGHIISLEFDASVSKLTSLGASGEKRVWESIHNKKP